MHISQVAPATNAATNGSGFFGLSAFVAAAGALVLLAYFGPLIGFALVKLLLRRLSRAAG
jgi:hypothetical protein